jgi:hypothetical protein
MDRRDKDSESRQTKGKRNDHFINGLRLEERKNLKMEKFKDGIGGREGGRYGKHTASTWRREAKARSLR